LLILMLVMKCLYVNIMSRSPNWYDDQDPDDTLQGFTDAELVPLNPNGEKIKLNRSGYPQYTTAYADTVYVFDSDYWRRHPRAT